MAQEGLLGADHQEAHNVVVDAGESLHLGLGEIAACRRGLYGVRPNSLCMRGTAP